MKQSIVFLLFSLHSFCPAIAQPLLSMERSVDLAVGNQKFLSSPLLNVKQQQVLLGEVKRLNNPQVSLEVSPYEGPLASIEQEFILPGVTRSRRALQNEKINLAKLQLLGSQYELKREVRLRYLLLQYYNEKVILLRSQDSLFQAIKVTAKRFFDAGQINKLEELTASSEADKVRNEMNLSISGYTAELELMNFYTGKTDAFQPESLRMYPVILNEADSVSWNKRLLKQQVEISKRELEVEKSGLLPTFSGGLSFPLSKDHERLVGFHAGVGIPIFRKQYRSRIDAAKLSVDIAESQRILEEQRFNASYKRTLAKLSGERASLDYYITTALPQSRLIINTSQRLFQGGELNYIESLRNLINAFEIQNTYLETLKNYNESVIELNYLNGTL